MFLTVIFNSATNANPTLLLSETTITNILFFYTVKLVLNISGDLQLCYCNYNALKKINLLKTDSKYSTSMKRVYSAIF